MHRNGHKKNSPVLHKIRRPPKLSFLSETPPKNWNSKFWTTKMGQAYHYMKMSEPTPTHPDAPTWKKPNVSCVWDTIFAEFQSLRNHCWIQQGGSCYVLLFVIVINLFDSVVWTSHRMGLIATRGGPCQNFLGKLQYLWFSRGSGPPFPPGSTHGKKRKVKWWRVFIQKDFR